MALLAQAAFGQSATNVAIASTYSFSLYVQGKTKEALAVMSKLPEADLRRGSIAAYYAVLLNGVGDTNKATVYREIGEKALLLPEERAMLAK